MGNGKCPYCGSPIINPNAKFCENCGALMEQKAQPAPQNEEPESSLTYNSAPTYNYTPTPNKNPGNGLGIAALILGILGFLTGAIYVGIVLDILAIILGIISYKNSKSKGGMAGFILGILGILLTTVFLVACSGCTSSSSSKVSSISSQAQDAEEALAVKEPTETVDEMKPDETTTKITTEEKTETDKADETPEFTIGTTADFDGVQVTLTSAVLSNGDGEIFIPDDGNYYLGLIFDIENNSDRNIAVSSVMSFDAYCDDFTTNMDLEANMAPEWDGFDQLDGTVAPGKKMRGVISYQVPKDFKVFDVVYSPSFWGNKEVMFTFAQDQTDKSAIEE